MDEAYLSLVEADSNQKPEDLMTYAGPTSRLYPPGPLVQQQYSPSSSFYDQNMFNDSLTAAPHKIQAPQFRDPLRETTDQESQNWWNNYFLQEGHMNPPATAFLVPKWANPSRAAYVPSQPPTTTKAMQQADKPYMSLDMTHHWGWQFGAAYNDQRLRGKTARLQELNRNIVKVPGSGHHLLAPGGGAIPLGPHLKPPRVLAPPASPTPLPRARPTQAKNTTSAPADNTDNMDDVLTTSSSSEPDDDQDEDYRP